MLAPVCLLDCQSADFFDKQLVCVHVFEAGSELPEPLLVRHEGTPVRSELKKVFQVGMPELVLCTTPKDFLTI